jgi:uncharacterized protein (DUF1330 family)
MEKKMSKLFGPGLGIVAGIAVGAAAFQGLHAQTKPQAYVVIPILKITDAETFKKIPPLAEPALAATGGHYVIRTDKTIKLDGNPPALLVVIAFDSVEKAQAYENHPAIQEVNKLRAASSESLSFIVQGTTD